MRQESLLCQAKASLRAEHGLGRTPSRRYPNLIEDIEFEGPDECWVGLITYVRLPSTFATWQRSWTPTRASVSAGI